MSQKKSVQKKSLKKRADEDQALKYKESLEADFQFIMCLLEFGSECVTESGELNVHALLALETSQLTKSQREIIENFQRYVVLDKYGDEGVVGRLHVTEPLNCMNRYHSIASIGTT